MLVKFESSPAYNPGPVGSVRHRQPLLQFAHTQEYGLLFGFTLPEPSTAVDGLRIHSSTVKGKWPRVIFTFFLDTLGISYLFVITFLYQNIQDSKSNLIVAYTKKLKG